MPVKKVIVAFVSLLFFGLFSWFVWDSYLTGPEDIRQNKIPLVKAEKGEIKIKPTDPGGLKIPDQDKLVYNRLSGDEEEAQVTVRKTSELPLSKPENSSASFTEGNDIQAVIPKVTPAEEGKANNNASAPLVSDDERVTAPDSQGNIAKTEKQKDVEKRPAQQPHGQNTTKTVTTPPIAISPQFKGAYMVQLGAFRDKSNAKALWQKLQSTFVMELQNLQPEYIMVDLGAKGVLYRLRGGALETRAAADQVCQKLKAKGQACIVARR